MHLQFSNGLKQFQMLNLPGSWNTSRRLMLETSKGYPVRIINKIEATFRRHFRATWIANKNQQSIQVKQASSQPSPRGPHTSCDVAPMEWTSLLFSLIKALFRAGNLSPFQGAQVCAIGQDIFFFFFIGTILRRINKPFSNW